MAKKYYQCEDTYQGEVDNEHLLQQLATYDEWALSTSSKALRDILPLCPPEVRVCAWVKRSRRPEQLEEWRPVSASRRSGLFVKLNLSSEYA
jgi:hypothetical protein